MFAIHVAQTGSESVNFATTVPPGADLTVMEVNETKWGFFQVLSMRPRLGAAWTWGRSSIGAEADFQPASENETIGIKRRDVWNARAGTLYF